jgi:bifunctional UDP-N-acetylglucosamine pyrophosphorylase/glucosamine-1-phosphate N-acetyltransferase
MKVVILAAGEGIRLKPLTDSNPKPLLKVLGEPILKRLINGFLKFGINSFVIVTHFMEEKIKDYLAKEFPTIEFTFLHQEEIKGTGNAFLLAKSEIEKDFFIGVNGDCIYSESLLKQTVIAARNGFISVGGKHTKETENFGIVIVDEEEKPIKIIEKPTKEDVPEGYANIGLYSLNKDIFEILENQHKNNEISSRGEYEIPDAVNFLLANKKIPASLVKLNEDDYWFDLGRPWSLLEANESLLSKIDNLREGTIEENVQIKGNIILKKGAILRSGTYIEGPAFFDEDSDIGPNCYIRKYSFFGKKSRIGNGCEVKNSVIGTNTHAAHLSYIGDSIIEDNCNLGAGTLTANLRIDKKSIPVTVKGKKEDSGRRKLGVIIGEGVETGIGALLMPGVKIGSNSWIGAGTIVKEDVPSDFIYFSTQNYTVKRKRKDAD